MGYNPSSFGTQNPAVAGISTSKFPVESVGWWDSVEFCNTLSEQEGLTPYYELTVTKRGGNDSKQITAADVKILGGNGYHIPRDVEWTHACAAGAKTKYHCGDKDEDLVEYAWFDANSDERSHRVGEKKPNAFGLYDMHGNVNEWNDRILTNAEIVNPKDAVNRGGAYRWTASQCEIRYWFAFDPKFALSWKSPSIGLRVARNPSGAASPEAKTPLAVAPFDATQAKNHQDSWAKHLSVPVECTNSIGMKFRLIPPGEFLMGASEAEIERILTGVTLNWQISRMKAEGPQQPMTVREPYYLGQHEVTLGQFRQFVQETGYKTTAETNGKGGERNLVEPERKIEVRPDYIWSNPIDSPTDDHPVVFVSLEDARQFCLWLGKKDGRSYALPRDDQWEFACRAGTTTRWFDETDVQRIAWVRENSEGRLHAIGLKAANPFGLCDMHGNAAELCEPVPPKKAARRGGDSTSSVVSCRSASRWELGDSLPWYRNGFRVAIVGDLNLDNCENLQYNAIDN